MVDLPRHDVTYPNRDTGRQGLDRPGLPDPDRTLLDLLARARGHSIAEVAEMIREAGYRRPEDVHAWADLMDHPPQALLLDGAGRPWTGDAIPEELWEKYGPWRLIYSPPVEDVPNTA